MNEYTALNGKMKIYVEGDKTLYVSKYITFFAIACILVVAAPLLYEVIKDLPFWFNKFF